jgi:chromosome segregation ATPase
MKEKEDRGPLDLTRQVEELQDRVKELDKSLSIALTVNESHQRYNGKLQVRVTELEEDNKKLAHQVEDLKMNGVRKAGL